MDSIRGFTWNTFFFVLKNTDGELRNGTGVKSGTILMCLKIAKLMA